MAGGGDVGVGVMPPPRKFVDPTARERWLAKSRAAAARREAELARLRELAAMLEHVPDDSEAFNRSLGLAPKCDGCGHRLTPDDEAPICLRCRADDEREAAMARRGRR